MTRPRLLVCGRRARRDRAPWEPRELKAVLAECVIERRIGDPCDVPYMKPGGTARAAATVERTEASVRAMLHCERDRLRAEATDRILGPRLHRPDDPAP